MLCENVTGELLRIYNTKLRPKSNNPHTHREAKDIPCNVKIKWISQNLKVGCHKGGSTLDEARAKHKRSRSRFRRSRRQVWTDNEPTTITVLERSFPQSACGSWRI
ncbi:hypothetical protein EVAR_89174_1 [Eumeta japonica]|uniref:Uncharacterized protein n=1 Tax=Eumeta variegata TaxID=151549 RepID=A0A4C2A3T5_EUMVA|nr:hypothetical protein EVAR_89174_1 [Eumeta japonica]